MSELESDDGEELSRPVVVDGEEAVELVGEDFFCSERNALILRFDDDCSLPTRSYSSMRLTRSSSDVIDTSASKSSVGS